MSRKQLWGKHVLSLVAEEMAALSEPGKIEYLNHLRRELHKLSPLEAMPVDLVQWVPVGDVEANDYNPNAVAPNEMRLLHTSISHDGYTQPVVVVRDEERGKFVIVDGFHRYSTARANADIQEQTKGCIPVVVLKKSINDRMASTIRHNRARGKHSVDGMADMVFAMLDEGWSDADICNEIGVSPEEMQRLKYVTGFAKLFESAEYKQAWTTARMAKMKREWKDPEVDQEESGTPAGVAPGGDGANRASEAVLEERPEE